MIARVLSIVLLLCSMAACEHKEKILMVALDDDALQWVGVQSDATLLADHVDQEARWILAQAIARAECLSAAAHRAPSVVQKRVKMASDAPNSVSPPKTKRQHGIDVNTASLSQLQRLPRVGPVLAQAIIDGRPYRSINDLRRVRGVGQKTLENMRSMLSVPGEDEDSNRTDNL